MSFAALRRFLAIGLMALAGCSTVPAPEMPPHIHYNCQPIFLFDHGSVELKDEYKKVLQDMLAGKGCPVWKQVMSNYQFSLIVRGFADSSGSSEENMALSLRRAEAVRDFLVSIGISAERIALGAYGDTRPLVRKKGREAQNRFVEVSLALNGREQSYM